MNPPCSSPFAAVLSASVLALVACQLNPAPQNDGTPPLQITDAALNPPPPGDNATLPASWVNNKMCNPPGGKYDNDSQLTDLSVTGLQTAINNWAAAPDQWWRIRIPARALLAGGGTGEPGYNADNALISVPAKVGATKCLVIESTTPLPADRMACSWGLPGYGGQFNPGCDGHTLQGAQNDVASMWTLRQDDTPAHAGFSGFYAGPGANHVVLRDVEATVLPGSSQSTAATAQGRRPILIDGADHVGLERYYVHGWDPGDPAQPSQVCANWTMSGTVTTNGVQVTWASGKYFGMTFTVGAPITIAGKNYVIAAHDPATEATTLTLTASAGVNSSAISYSLSNPPAQYAHGCGDDLETAVNFNCDSCWRMYGYIDKVHLFSGESHTSLQGFSNGPVKIAHNTEYAGSCGYFSGGGPVDTHGGPTYDMEIRGNYFGRDANYRFLTGNSGHSPPPPFGAGPLDDIAGHDNAPFNWAVKNTFELKLCRRCLIDGNIFSDNWADGQAGHNPVIGVRTISGGATAGIFDDAGMPRTAVDNIRFTNNWIRNSPQGLGLATRSGTPGNGGGVSLPIGNVDLMNNVFSNIADTNEFNTPGTALVEWGFGSNKFNCTMSRASGVAHAACAVGSFDTSNDHISISNITRGAGNVVTVSFGGERHDPVIGGLVTVYCTPGDTCPSGWTGNFTISGALSNGQPVDPNAQRPGTFGDALQYVGAAGAPLTLCDSVAQCNQTNLQVNAQTWAYSITDINVGDDVHVTDTGGACTAYQTGTSTASLALTPTNPTGLDVYYANPGPNDAAGTVCVLDNGSGNPKNAKFTNNALVSSGTASINSPGEFMQHINNHIFDNIFAVTDPGLQSDVTCGGEKGEGVNAFACWDQSTFEFYANVLEGRQQAFWPQVPGVPDRGG